MSAQVRVVNDASDVEVARRGLGRVRPAVRIGPLSLVWRRRVVLVCIALVVLCFLAACLSTTTGAFPISLPDVVSTVLGGGSERQRFIVVDTRMPRAAAGLLVGAALGLSGALVQSMARNPLASPDILGVNAGAGLVAVAALTGVGGLVGGITGAVGLSVAAMAGGLLTGAAVYLLAWRRGMDGQRLVLTGVALTALLGAVTEWLLLRVDLKSLTLARTWLYGSLGDAAWSDVTRLGIGLTLLGGSALACGRTLQAMHHHDDLALGLGVRLGLARAVLLVVAVLLVGLATATAGPIGFVAFVAPQLALRLVGQPTPGLVSSALTGAALLVLADWLARVVLPMALPVGVITSLVGGPVMVLLLVNQSRKVTV